MLKFFLAQRALNETFLGGVGSFMLQLMARGRVGLNCLDGGASRVSWKLRRASSHDASSTMRVEEAPSSVEPRCVLDHACRGSSVEL